jgi:hypothetical protein
MTEHRFQSVRALFERAADLPAGAEVQQEATVFRTEAACFAALAAAGKGQDAAKLDDKERATLRRQALDWLKADLAALAKLLDKGAPKGRKLVQEGLRHWQKDPDLAGVRDKDALAKLPQDQRQAWGQLWAGVADLLKRADGSE